MPPTYRIMVFSWNTESVSIAESLDPSVIEINRTSGSQYIPGVTSWRYDSLIADFFPKLLEFIEHHKPDIIIFGLQEDRWPGSYFHSHLLPSEMPCYGYGLVKRTKLMGVGITSYKGALHGDLFERGIRVSIYARHNLIPQIEYEERNLRMMVSNEGQTEYICSPPWTRGKGATCSYLMLPGYGRLAFICCHLPFNASTLTTSRLKFNPMIRQNELNKCNVCYNDIIENLILNCDVVPSHVIYFGDFNYRLSDPRSADEVAFDIVKHHDDTAYLHELYLKHDELKDQMRRENIYEFSEGLDNTGPAFIPTCKMSKGRSPDYESQTKSWKTGVYDQRVPSWCDRILHRKFTDDGHNLKCTYYDRFDYGNTMAQSDHAAVMSMFELS